MPQIDNTKIREKQRNKNPKQSGYTMLAQNKPKKQTSSYLEFLLFCLLFL